MAYDLHGIVISPERHYSLNELAERLRADFTKDPVLSLQQEEGALPIKPPHLRIYWDKDDADEPGSWWSTVEIEEGPTVAVAAAGAAAAEVRTDAAAIAASRTRIRVHCASDPDRRFSTRFVMLIEFLQGLPGVVVYDPQRGDFLE